MEIRTDEIAERIYRVSVFLPQGAGGRGFMFNHFLIDADKPLLFHCGLRKMFTLVSAEVAISGFQVVLAGSMRRSSGG